MHRGQDSSGVHPVKVVALIVTGALALATAPLAAPGQDPQRLVAYQRAAGLLQRRSQLPGLRELHRARPAPWPADAVAGALLVTSSSAAAAEAVRSYASSATIDQLLGTESVRLSDRVSKIAVPVGREAAAATALAAQPGVVAVEPVRKRRPAGAPDDTSYPDQWAHALTGIEAAWEVETGSAAVRVAVIDTGALGNHPDLADNVVDQVNVSTGAVQGSGAKVDNDPCGDGHGSLVAGVVGAVGNNGTDVAGVNWEVSILDIAAFSSDCQFFTDDAVVAGMDYATNHPAGPVDVINLSLGATQEVCPAAYQSAIDAARAAGIVVMAAAGNEELDPELAGRPATPASCNGVISVGAIGADGARADYSTTNPHVDLAAPGGDSADGFDAQILSTSRNGRIEPTEGTSFAAPYVAGLAALLRAINPGLAPDDIESILEQTALDAGAPGRDPEYGWGIVQAGVAASLAASGQPAGAPQPDPPFPVAQQSATADVQPPPINVVRVSAGTGSTEAVTQAVAVSQEVFAEGGAVHAVLARSDDYADALGGSALAFGVGPLLFTSSIGPLAEATKQELQRVLPSGSVVYLLGGPAALPPTLEAELRTLGYESRRLAGLSREETAVQVAEEVRRRLPELGFDNLPIVLLATRENWPDAVAAGSLAAFFGIPILLTAPQELHPATGRTLAQLAPDLLYGLGGTTAISQETLEQAAETAGSPDVTIRLAGPERTSTAVAVATEFEDVLEAVFGSEPAFAVAVNLRRADGFAHVLSASAIPGAFTGVFVPVERDDGTLLTEPTRGYAAGLGIDGVVAGDVDLVAGETAAEFGRLLQHR